MKRRTRRGPDRRCQTYDRRVGDSQRGRRLAQGATFLSDDLEQGLPGDKIQTPAGWPEGGLGEITAQGDEGPCDLSTERIRSEGNPDRQGSEWARKRYLEAAGRIMLEVALNRAQSEAGHWCNTPQDETRIAVNTVATALSWWRDRSLETWKLVWLFLDTQQPSRPIGVGWRGKLLIWRSP